MSADRLAVTFAAYRARHRCSDEQLAAVLGLPLELLPRRARCRTPRDSANVELIADAFGIHVDRLADVASPATNGRHAP